MNKLHSIMCKWILHYKSILQNSSHQNSEYYDKIPSRTKYTYNSRSTTALTGKTNNTTFCILTHFDISQ